jgi:SPP1 family predicted phage head-tail adaptor
VLQRKTSTISSSGSPTETWSTLATVWANVKPITGTERNAAQQWIAREQTQFTVRWSDDVANFSPLDRVIYPAADVGSSPLSNRSIYDVMAVHEPQRQVNLVIMAARRVA